MRCLDFLSRYITHTKAVVYSLKIDGIEEKRIHTLGRSDIPMRNLPARPALKTFIRAMLRVSRMTGTCN